MTAKDKILTKIINVLNNTKIDSELYLFGSRVKGNVKKLSDWDLLILLNLKDIPFEFEIKLMDDLYEIEIETGEIISPLIYTKDDWNKKYLRTPLHDNICKKGLRIR